MPKEVKKIEEMKATLMEGLARDIENRIKYNVPMNHDALIEMMKFYFDLLEVDIKVFSIVQELENKLNIALEVTNTKDKDNE